MKTKTAQSVEVSKVPRNAKGQLMPGNALSPGRPKLGNDRLALLLKSIQRVENKLNKNLLDHFVTRAFRSDKVLISVLQKLIPDLKSIELSGGSYQDSMPSEMAAEIQKKLSDRFGSSGSKNPPPFDR